MSVEREPPKARYRVGRRLPWLAGAALPLAALDGGGMVGLGAMAAVDAFAGLLGAVEGSRLRARVPEVRRVVPSRLVEGVPSEMALEIRNRGASRLRAHIRDMPPPGFAVEPDPVEVEVPPHGHRLVRYHVTPPRRGDYVFGRCTLRLHGVLGLADVDVRVAEEVSVRVYPNLLGRRTANLPKSLDELRLIGSHASRASGGGGDLDHLREYVPGDPYRHLDWKATAKRGRPVTRVFDQERSQQVVVCLDVGRMMETPIEGVTKLDHALRAALLLAWVALQNGDRVGAVVFADTVRGFIPPGKGPSQYRRILEALYRVRATPTYVDFRRLAEHLQRRARRRSLLVLFSDLLDESQALPLVEHVAVLGRRHLPLCVTMNDPVADRMSQAPVQRAIDAYMRAAATDIVSEREALGLRLTAAGAFWVEAPAGELALSTIRRYMEIKSRKIL